MMRIIPALFFGIALAISLCVQTMNSPLAGAWLFFLLCSCAIIYVPRENKGLIWWAATAWLFTLGLSTFVLAPVGGGAATMFILAALPLVAITVDEATIKSFLGVAFTLLFIYALMLIGEAFMNLKYTYLTYPGMFGHGYASAWPLLDPNNAACLINMALIPCFWKATKKPLWFLVFMVFVFALVTTTSRMGIICAGSACAILLAYRINALAFILTAMGLAIIIAFNFVDFDHIVSIQDRLNVWRACLPLLELKPYNGTGLGTFWVYYSQVKTESRTAGVYAHNDLMQLAIEMGFPCLLSFIMVGAIAAFKTTEKNIVSFCTMLAVAAHSMIEFQFYIPSVSLLMGLALAYHSVNSRVRHNSEPV